MKRYLVTGGAGFVGSNLALEIEKRGLGEVVVLDDFSSASFENLAGFKGDVVTANAESQEWWPKAGKVDAIFHQAAITDTTVTDQNRMMKVNVEGWRSVLEFALKKKVRRVVYASSAGVYGNGPCPMREEQGLRPENVYGYSKRVMDGLAMDFARRHPKVMVVGLRYFNVYGPRESHKGKFSSMIWQLAGQIRSGRRPRIFKFGEQGRDFIYVKDVVEANLCALKAKQSAVVNACTGKAETFNRVIELLNQALGASFEPEYFDNPYPFYQNRTQGDPLKAKRLLGFEARWSLEKGIFDYFSGEKVPALV